MQAAKEKLLSFGVSRETLDKFALFQILLENWNKRINLIGKTTENDFWQRHILDSAQIYFLIPQARNWVDFGSGAGFPGLIIARLLLHTGENYRVRLIEASNKRASFLREAARVLAINPEIINEKIENVAPEKFEIVTARAFAPLEALFEHSFTYAQLGATLLFPKGQNVSSEIEQAQKKWQFNYQIIPSLVDEKSVILKISELQIA